MKSYHKIINFILTFIDKINNKTKIFWWDFYYYLVHNIYLLANQFIYNDCNRAYAF